MSDTIVAIASPPGGGARGIVRLSGPRAFELASGVVGASPRGRTVARTSLRLPGGLTLPASAWFTPGPASYTGEDVAELHVPGSPPVLRLLVDTLVSAGARPAGPGEFTLRAYRNGRIDLAQAEAVQALIAARDAHEARAARARLDGELSRPLRRIEEDLLDLCAGIEASLDFAEEDVRPDARIRELRERLAPLVCAERGAEEPRPSVLLWGVPNVGKTLLFNRLTGSDAIVSDVPGTTRDVLDGEVDGIRILDAAGAQEAAGADAAAVDRARAALAEADLILVVVDATRPADLPPPVDRPSLRVVNKCDLARVPGGLRVSAKTGEGVAELRAELGRRLRETRDGSGVHAGLRQAASLREAAAALARAEEAPDPALRAADLRAAADAIGAVTGRSVADEVLSRIFSRFCIGK
ncbi:MAG: 50S ribosome-binding GTPase [Planctomycetes bacterium]|nr:50S ribosome-binding GTPase [Planctomycetota bacterium]